MTNLKGKWRQLQKKCSSFETPTQPSCSKICLLRVLMMAESEGDSTLTPTDQSVTFSSTLDSSNSTKLDITREELEKRQLVHKLQLLKLEVAQKNLVIETLKNEQASQVEELREKLSDTLHEKKLVQMRLKSMTQAYEEEFKQLQRKTQEEIAAVRERQRQLECANPFLAQRVEELKQALHSPQLSEPEYLQLRSQDPNSLSLQDYILLRYYEVSQPLQRECREKGGAIAGLTDQLRGKEEQLTACQEELETSQNHLTVESRRVRELELQCSQLAEELTRTRTLIQEGNYKIDNFDKVRRERDGLQGEVDRLRRVMAELEGASKASREEREQARNEFSTAQQSVALLRQDKEYLSRQLSEAMRRAQVGEDRSEALSQQLAEAKDARERAYEQLLKSREEQKLEYDRRWQQEAESLRARTALEMEQIKSQTREMFERENKSLSEARDGAYAERDRAVTAEKEMTCKHDQLVKEYHQLQVTLEGRLSELHAELQLRQLEGERGRALQEEATRDLRQRELEEEKLKKKVELLTQELWSTQNECSLRVRELESRLQDQSQRLEIYEKLERELDDVVMQAAEIESESDAEKVLFSYGFGTSVPSTSRRRMQQSVQLARRVLQLERVNVSLRKDHENTSSRATELEEELSKARELLSKSQQPYSYLIEAIQARDEQLRTARENTTALEKDVRQLREERAQLTETKNQMAADLERLLNHREELRMMKQVIIGLQSRQTPQLDQSARFPPEAAAPESDPNTHSPPPTLFTKQEPPSWYRNLKQHSQTKIPPR